MRLMLGIFAILSGFVAANADAQEESDDAFLFDDEAAKAREGDQTEADVDEKTGSFRDVDQSDEAFLKGEQQAEIAPPAKDIDAGLAEDPQKAYFSLGLRYRWVPMPRWLIGMFGVDIQSDSGLLISGHGVGPEFTYRRNDLDITAAVWFLSLGWDGYVSFKESGASGNSWEVVENDLKTILLTVDFIWSTPIRDWVAVTYGVGLGVGIPLGGLERTEASYSSDGKLPCTDAQTPRTKGGLGTQTDIWCGSSDDEQYEETYDLPTGIIPWINFLAGVRFKPHRNVAIYVDTGFGIGFQAGARAGYVF